MNFFRNVNATAQPLHPNVQDGEDDDDEDEEKGEAEKPKKSVKIALSHKEKKELKKRAKMEAEMERITKKGGEGHSELSANFSVSQALKTGGALTQMETAVDIKVEKFRYFLKPLTIKIVVLM